MRQKQSLLLANGHRHAQSYPLGMLTDEATIITQRLNRHEATRATLTQSAILAALSKSGQRSFKKTIEDLNDED